MYEPPPSPAQALPVHLVQFMTAGMSLRAWDRSGLLGREVALYRALRGRLAGLTLVTYGDSRDLAYAGELPGVDVVCNRLGLPASWFLWLGAMRTRRAARGSLVVRTNQLPGADRALAFARRAGARFLARCGYPHALNVARRHGPDDPRSHEALALERAVFRSADHAIVSSRAMAEAIAGRHELREDMLSVVPNYVLVDAFAPDDGVPDTQEGPPRVLFVGRLSEEKNVSSLLEAVRGLGVVVDVVGKGPLGPDLERLADRLGLHAEFHGVVPHDALPAMMRRAEVFVLPSLYEGHPKALLEAMSCGRAVVATDVAGSREVVRHGSSGLLTGTAPDDIRDAVSRLLADAGLRERLGKQARRQVVDENSLARIVELELDVYRAMLASPPRPR